MITLFATEINELRISAGEIGFVLTCPADMQKDIDLTNLMQFAGSDEFTFTVEMKPDIPDVEKEEAKDV